MNPRHHPSADVLAAYAAGALAPGFGLVVGAHLERCAQCRKQVDAYEAASGEALATLPAVDLSSDALTAVMARLQEPAPPPPQQDARPFIERLPLKPRRWVAPGVWVAAVDTPHAPQDRVYLLSVAPGMPTARHEHAGAEFCTVLTGAYQDELGVFSAGDFASAERDLNHQPRVIGSEPCVCLFATEGRLKAHGLIGRLAFAFADV
ncbi:MAG TPA: ChrR family anti-sigma-E factor [Vitreimonas sp.]|uniref:ChrR family anti-sigma-E factor n=1 Tax=Vitreimonas sp. TaxID=3069702 RepID=UPI002D3EE4A7|nr:ChrR family anti-sigma-E factor [Vitreimonas sp.]HYD89423.1 ChrR family anti-sigma-E factor [Vitreimonas sp.]